MSLKKNSSAGSKKEELCPLCNSVLGPVITTKSGKQLRRCSAGKWNEATRRVEGCQYVKWLPFVPQKLDEKCPKCKAPLVLNVTRSGKKMKKCSTNIWDPQTRTAKGCDYIEWVKSTIEHLNEKCPTCGAGLVLLTTQTGKKLKKCSTNKWDREERKSIGCQYAVWM